MKVAWSVLVGDARGTLGSIAATSTRFGPVLRASLRSMQPNSQLQLMMRANLGNVSGLWRSASMAAYRAGWILLAAANPEPDVFGNMIKKTGLQWFVRCNRNRQTFGLPPILAAPAFAPVGNPGTLTLSHDGPPPTYFHVAPTSAPAPGEAVVIQATKGLSPGLLTFSNQARNLKTINPGTGGPWDILTEYTAKFRAPIDRLQIFVTVHYLDIAQGRAGLTGTASIIW